MSTKRMSDEDFTAIDTRKLNGIGLLILDEARRARAEEARFRTAVDQVGLATSVYMQAAETEALRLPAALDAERAEADRLREENTKIRQENHGLAREILGERKRVSALEAERDAERARAEKAEAERDAMVASVRDLLGIVEARHGSLYDAAQTRAREALRKAGEEP